MNVLLATIPVSIFLGLLGLAAFLWSLRRGQYKDLEGDAARVLFSGDDGPGPDPKAPKPEVEAPKDGPAPHP